MTKQLLYHDEAINTPCCVGKNMMEREMPQCCKFEAESRLY